MLIKKQSAPDLLFKFTLFLALIIVLIASWNAPISGDEFVHVKQAEKNINYFQSLGNDKDALNTPISRLKHYGQSFDTLTTWVADIFEIDNLYRFRHVSNAVVAWGIILFSSLITLKISKSKLAAFITVILFLISARFMGHATNNLKDIPFAFAFIFSLYFIFRFITKLPEISWKNLAFLTFGIASGISIRIGGLLIYAYFLLFTGLYLYVLIVANEIRKKHILPLIVKLGVISGLLFLVSYVFGILLWPFALENPLLNPIASLDLMHQYPTTVRQIFEGKLFWSDKFPWYYLPKYLLITLPIVIWLGVIAFFVLIGKLKERQSIILSIFTLIAFGFPLFYAAASGANVYGGWRQLLFSYPPLLVLASIGLWAFYTWSGKWVKVRNVAILAFVVMLMHPIQYAVQNYPYLYIYFNQFAGGVKGAYGNYELDYYFTSYKKAYEFIDRQSSDTPKIVAANFIIPEYYNGKTYKPKWIDYYDRAGSDWDYAIICNTFLDPFQLKKNIWPPANAIYTEEVEGRPILAILKRESKIDLEGKQLLNQGDFEGAIQILNRALEIDNNNESILINLIDAYIKSGKYRKANATIDHLLSIYPQNEWGMDKRGEMLLAAGKVNDAIDLFHKNIAYNYKFYHSYISLAKAYISIGKDDEAIKYLKACLRINPYYEPAYKEYGQLLIEKGEVELGNKMLKFSIEGNSKYGRK